MRAQIVILVLTLSLHAVVETHAQPAPERVEIAPARSLSADDMRALDGIEGYVRVGRDKAIPPNLLEELERQAVPPTDMQFDESVTGGLPGATSSSAFGYTPRMLQNFAGTGNAGYPADPMIAAGPSHVVVVVNTLMRVFDKAGVQQLELALGSLFPPNNGFALPHYDPKVIYDKNSGRFMLLDLSMDCVNDVSNFNLAVSKTSNPLDGWWIYVINNYRDENWIDYPGLGVGEDALYFGGNYLGRYVPFPMSPDICPATIQYENSQWIVDKTPLLSGAAASAWQFIDLNKISPTENSGYIQPVVTWNAPLVYDGFLTAIKIDLQATTDTGYVWGVTLPPSFPAVPPVLDRRTVTLPERGPAPAPTSQLGGGARLSAWDFGAPPSNAMCYNDRLATVTHRAVGTTAGNIQYILYDVSAFPTVTLVREGLYGSGVHTYFYPATALNFSGDEVFSFARSSPVEYVGARWALWMRDEPAAAGSQFTKAGEDYYGTLAATDSTAIYRWGDYGGAATDPADEGFWVYHIYARPRTAALQYGTWIGYVARPVFVDGGNGATGVGSRSNPFRFFGQGVLTAKANNDLVVKTGSYNEAVTISLPINLIPDGGPVTIGQ